MRCEYCGSGNDHDAQYCSYCGFDFIQGFNPEKWFDKTLGKQPVFTRQKTPVKQKPLETVETVVYEPVEVTTHKTQYETPEVVQTRQVKEKKKDNQKGMATAGFVLGVSSIPCWVLPGISIFLSPVSLIMSVLGMIFSILGIKSEARKLAIAGAIISGLAMIASMINSGTCMGMIQSCFR